MTHRPLALTLAACLALAAPSLAHPGGTDARGGHTCRTSCPRWGLEYGEYHFHGSARHRSPRSRSRTRQQAEPQQKATPRAEASPPSVIELKLETKVQSVPDGDTFVARVGGRARQIHLVDVDAPELGQPFGDTARERLATWISGRVVEVVVVDDDGTGGKWARVFVDGGTPLAHRLLEAGLAWRRPGRAPELRDVEQAARRDRRGLWRRAEPVAPWLWRQRHGPGGGS